ncbi:nuclear transport factor 2 family protein [Chelativorans sp. AA-79]|uniref:nuclear transport factor 2 family protein n=1 Tax=Chelativorans sp. AA-79 TaxID=3028735 RepID=UPI0023F66E7C|nr:nuclear transport factor 2 family protein [Chelativorans sp. AA-79]WEX09572.1 nuclear transport factor 2 family protein [Chelativorans sp. AA-79]
MPDLSKRSTAEVLADHLRCRIAGEVEQDIERNYAPDVVVMTAKGMKKGHAAVRDFAKMLVGHVPPGYEFPMKLIEGPFAFIEWRAREPGRSVEDGADSFVVQDGKIVFQSIHYSLQETMPG